MKKNIFLIGCMLLMLASCQTSVLDPLEGIFPAPTDVKCTSGNCDAYKIEGVRYFALSVSDGSRTLQALLIGDSYYLTTNAYTGADPVTAKKGNYVLGITNVNNTAVESGTINVSQNGEYYRVSAVLFLADGSPYRFVYEGQFYFEPDPEPVKLTKVLAAQANTNNTVTFKLGTDEMSLDGMGSPTGDGYAFTADVYSADGYLHEGVYTAAPSSDNVGPGQFTPGYPFDLSPYGMDMVLYWGTCWWVGSTANTITDGTVTVELKGSKYTITWGSEETYPNWATFTGEISDLLPQGGGGDDYDGVTLTQNFGIIDYSMYGMNMVGIELGTPGIVATPGGWGNTYTGNGNYLKLEIYAENGKIAPGTYKACAQGGVIGEGEFGIGYDGMYGASGTTWYTLVNDEATYKYITDGTVVVEVDGDDYKITIESSVVNARYGFDEGGSGDDPSEGVELTQFCGLVDYYSMYQVNLVGMELATAGVTVTAGAWGNTYGGEGNYIKLELYTADGKVAPGTYTPCAEGGVVGEGQFGIGYDGSWGASGTTWYTLAGGETTYVYVTDGTVEVSVDGDVYTISIESTAVTAKYVGKLSAE